MGLVTVLRRSLPAVLLLATIGCAVAAGPASEGGFSPRADIASGQQAVPTVDVVHTADAVSGAAVAAEPTVTQLPHGVSCADEVVATTAAEQPGPPPPTAENREPQPTMPTAPPALTQVVAENHARSRIGLLVTNLAVQRT